VEVIVPAVVLSLDTRTHRKFGGMVVQDRQMPERQLANSSVSSAQRAKWRVFSSSPGAVS
jgi:hypothetical protein